jgi:hypothetical protein
MTLDPLRSSQSVVPALNAGIPSPVRSASVSSLTVVRSPEFNVIQTFFVDAAAVQGAPTVAISSVDLFFRGKPDTILNASGLTNPGVSVSLCEVENGIPNLQKEFIQVSRLSYDEIFAVSDSSVASTFGFEQPILVPTDRYYGIIVRYEDSNFTLWTNRRNDAILGTNLPSPGSTGSRDGNYFLNANTASLTPQTDIDLKYRVKVCRYTTGATTTIELVNNDYEFLTIDSRSATFVGGEDIFITSSAQTGTLNIQSGNVVVVGTGTTLTNLTEGQRFIIQSGGRYGVGVVESIANTTQMSLLAPMNFTNTTAAFHFGPVATLDRANYVTGKLKLSGSTANTTVKFSGAAVIRGSQSNATANIVSVDNLTVDEFLSHVNIVSQAPTTVVPTYDVAVSNATNYLVDSVYDPLPQDTLLNLSSNTGYILSRSTEVAQSYLYTPSSGASKKSFSAKVAIGTQNEFVSPFVDQASADLTVRQVLIGNTTSHIVSSLDSEIGANGVSPCKHLCKKMTFEASRQAEDLRVFMSAYRPAGTDIRAYAKVHNAGDQEAFDDKPWSPLEIKNNRSNIYSATGSTEFVEYEFGFPKAPETSEVLVGSFTVVDNNATITGNGTADLTTKVVAGSKVRIYNPLFPDTNYIVATVASRTSTTITFSELITDDNVVGNGMKVDVLKYNVAFSNKSNNYVTRYYDSTGAAYDKFNTVQVKIVLQSNRTSIVPRVTQVETIGVSA